MIAVQGETPAIWNSQSVWKKNVHLNTLIILSVPCPRPTFKSNIVRKPCPPAPISSPGPVLALHWSNYTHWPPTGRLSKGPLKINIHSLRSVIRFWHYRPCSVSELSLSVLYSYIYPPRPTPHVSFERGPQSQVRSDCFHMDVKMFFPVVNSQIKV